MWADMSNRACNLFLFVSVAALHDTMFALHTLHTDEFTKESSFIIYDNLPMQCGHRWWGLKGINLGYMRLWVS